MSWQRVTIIFVSWDWQTLLGSKVVEMHERQLADQHFSDSVCRMLMREFFPDAPADTHSAIALGDLRDEDLAGCIPQLREAHERRAVRRSESWPAGGGLTAVVHQARVEK